VFKAKILPVIVDVYIMPFSKTGDDTIGPNSFAHRKEGLQDKWDADNPVCIIFPLNIFNECSFDFPTNSLDM
jgi:hypothetical protein